MKRFASHPLTLAIATVGGFYVFLAYAVQPPLPRSVMIQFMTIVTVGVLLYASFDERRWSVFKQPILAALRDDNKWPIRGAFLIAVPALVAGVTYESVAPSMEPPVELRQVHPAPPSRLTVYGKSYDLLTLENPVRAKILAQLRNDPAKAMAGYRTAIGQGRDIYYQNCFYCHGDLQDGQGMFADGLNPRPANFRDVGTIAQLQEAYLFWRIATGGPGLPPEGTPWNSAMPVWQEMLKEDDVWNVIMFLYDRVGQVPRMWDKRMSEAATSMRDKIEAQRAKMGGKELYGFYCSVCHGEQGAGNGLAAKFLYPAPRDFTEGLFKYKTSPPKTTPPTDDDIFNTVAHGLPGTGMPAWGSLLSDAQIRSLVAVVKGFDTVGTWAPQSAPDSQFDKEGHFKGKALSVAGGAPSKNRVPFSEASVAKGKIAFERTCAQCHGNDGRGNPAVDKRLHDEWGNRIWPRDLTKPWTWRVTNVAESVDETIGNIFTRLSVGIPGTPMPAHADKLGEEDRWNIANFVYTLRNYTPSLSASQTIVGLSVPGALPKTVNDPAWAGAPVTALRMIPNIIKGQRLFKALTDAIGVRVLYNKDEIAFLLEMDDRTYSLPGDPDAESTQDKSLELYSDAFAVEFPKNGAFAASPVVEKPLFRHGDSRHPTTIWYWNAGSVVPKVSPFTMIFDATDVNTKLTPRKGSSGVAAKGEWVNGRWRVMITRRRSAPGNGDLSFKDGQFYPVAFANWDGSNGEKGAMHTLSSWYWLLLPPPEDRTKTFVMPLAAGAMTFLFGILLIRRERKKSAEKRS